MARILVTGGRGVLGRELVSRLQQGPNAIYDTVRVMSRSPRPTPTDRQIEWAQADLETGDGLVRAVEGVDVILHAASNPFRKMHETDVVGTERLLGLAARSGVSHLIYISIVGIERVPGYAYYRHKLAAEALIKQNLLPWTILRTTQFYNLVDMLLSLSARLPIMLLPTGFRSQPIDVGEVADRMAALVEGPARGMLPDVGGPEIMTLGEAARLWKRTRGIHKPVVNLPIPGRAAAAFKNGSITTPDHAVGTVTWSEWLQHTYGNNPQQRSAYLVAREERMKTR